MKKELILLFVLNLVKLLFSQEILEDRRTCSSFNCFRDRITTLEDKNKYLAMRYEERDRQINDLEKRLKECEQRQEKAVIAKDCLDLYNHNVRKNGIYHISPDSHTTFDVYCDMDGGGWTLMLRRGSGSVNFHRGWDEYVTGFGDLSSNFWLGLEYTRLLTNPPVDIMFEGYTRDTNEMVTMRYGDFHLDGSDDNYRMHVNVNGVYNNIARQRNYDRGDNGFGYHNGRPFATYDRPDQNNAVRRYKGGWWYKDYWEVFLTGSYDRMSFHDVNSNANVRNVTVKLRQA